MSLIYIIKTNSEHFYFHYVSKLLKSHDNDISLTTTESKFLLKLCESQIEGVVITTRAEMEGHIWGDEATGIDRKANLNQLICTLRKKLTQVTTHSVIITQPKKGYSLDDCVYVEQYPTQNKPLPTAPRWVKEIRLARSFAWLRQFYLAVVSVVVIGINGYLFSIYPEKPTPLESITVKKIEGDRGVLTTSLKTGVTISCIETLANKTKFTNYFIVGLGEGVMNEKWERKVCELL